MSAKRVLFITQEVTPYVPESDMSIIGQNLPQAIQDRGYEIRTFMPKWGHINERRNQLHEVIRLSGMNIIIDETDHPLIIKVASIQAARRQIYFIDNEDYFQHRLMATDADGKEYEDNGERAIFYARGVLETVKKLRWSPEVIHCHGWMSAIVPLYIKKFYKDDPSFKGSKIVFSLYEDGFSEALPKGLIRLMNLKGITAKDTKMMNEPATHEDLCKLAIAHSDAIIQNSKNVN
ncbi:MAG: glycogen/starch synthase, partial [Phocaeicola sp.]|nr:glycogen/starch synthase [Phocaeicola sp.]